MMYLVYNYLKTIENNLVELGNLTEAEFARYQQKHQEFLQS